LNYPTLQAEENSNFLRVSISTTNEVLILWLNSTKQHLMTNKLFKKLIDKINGYVMSRYTTHKGVIVGKFIYRAYFIEDTDKIAYTFFL